MTSFEQRVELLRLARVLNVEPDALDFLDGAAADDLRAFRTAVMDRLLERREEQFRRAAALADRVPVALAAKLAQHAVGPVLSARIAALHAPERAAELARRLPPDFLADVAVHLDLRRVAPLLERIAPETMAASGEHLRERGEWMVLAAFVGHVREEVLREQIGDFDGEALLRTGYLIEDDARLDELLARVDDARLDEVLAAAGRHGLWPEAIALSGRVGDEQRARIGAALERLGDDEVRRIADVLDERPDLAEAAAPLAETFARRLERAGG
jgi:hypothetical protein